MKVSIGIDPGYTGAIAIITNSNPYFVYDMPVIKIGTKTELDMVGIKSLLEGYKNHETSIYLEKAQAMPGQGISSTANYIKGYGQIIGLLFGMGISFSLVHPVTWKNKMMRDMPKEKNSSVIRCQQIYPRFSEQFLKLKKHHGRADAILIAVYGDGL